jgi:hypothetical protein
MVLWGKDPHSNVLLGIAYHFILAMHDVLALLGGLERPDARVPEQVEFVINVCLSRHRLSRWGETEVVEVGLGER